MASKSALVLPLSIILSLSLTVFSEDCVYTVYVRTGSVFNGGTDSIISLTLITKEGDGVLIRNLEKWGGLMGPDYNYFERGNLDIFSGRGPCLSGPVCYMNVTSDGSGEHHGWYCNYVEVTTTGVHRICDQAQFEVEEWLALDRSPYSLTFIKDQCPVKRIRSQSDLVNLRSGLMKKSTFVV